MLEKTLVLDLIKEGKNTLKKLKKATKSNPESDSLDITINDLIKEKNIVYDKTSKSYFILKTGIIDIKQSGFGFIKSNNEENKEYFVPACNINNVYSGDEVIFYAYEMGEKLENAAIYEVTKRKNTTLIGKLVKSRKKNSNKYFVLSSNKDFNVKPLVKGSLNGAIEGSIVLCDIIYSKSFIDCVIKEVIGDKDDPGIEITEIAYKYGFRKEFPVEVLDEIKLIPNEVTEEDKVGRRDFTDNTVITIDGDDSKDFDDAIYLEKLANGNYKLDVYIADVAHYVKDNTSLNKEALKRGTSVYLADRVIPMLPKKLSNGICSLNEGVSRLVLACLMEIDHKGNLVDYEICEGIIKSHHRMTYNNVNKIFNKDIEMLNKYSDIVPMLNDMLELSKIIRNRRYNKGGLEFESSELKITLNPDSSPKEISFRERGDSEKMIEDFMLQANETIAYNMSIMNLPCAYRIHEKPEQEKLHEVFDVIKNMGVNITNPKFDIKPKQIQDVLAKINETSYKGVFNNLLLRSMTKAKYSPNCLGHYGLAMNYYCHFTSPIRRYPDLITHRMIKNLLLHPSDKYLEDLEYYNSNLGEICDLNSFSERASIDCEREVNDMLYAWYMEKYIHFKLSGVITSIKNFGMFVSLDNGIEGFISIKDMDGYFDYDERNITLQSFERCYRLGDKVNIIVMNTSRTSGKIDFMLEEDYNIYFGDINENSVSE